MLLVPMTIAETTRGGKRREGALASTQRAEIGPKPVGTSSSLKWYSDWILIGSVLLSSSLSFGLGWLAHEEVQGGEGVLVEQGASSTAVAPIPVEPSLARPITPSTPAAAAAPVAGGYVASKSGTKYYLPWCGSVSRIKEENKVWFATKEEAEAAGYKPATNCKGM